MDMRLSNKTECSADTDRNYQVEKGTSLICLVATGWMFTLHMNLILAKPLTRS